MILRGIKISGWRSFAPDLALDINELAAMNLVVGPNNAGKSNIARFLLQLQRWCMDVSNGIEGDPSHPANSRLWERCVSFPVELSASDTWMKVGGDVQASLELDASVLNRVPDAVLKAYLRDPDSTEYAEVQPKPKTVVVAIQVSGGQLTVCPALPSGKPLYRRSGQGTPAVWIASGEDYVSSDVIHGTFQEGDDTRKVAHQAMDEHYYVVRHLGPFLAFELAQSIKEMTALRHYSRSPVTSHPASADGNDVRAQLLKLATNDEQMVHWTAKRKFLAQALALLLGEERVVLEIHEGKVRVELVRGETNLPLSLEEHGAGTAEMFIMLGWLVLHPERPQLLVLEEPEAHLHASAVLALLQHIQSSFGQHQFFVTSHSAALVDSVDPSWSFTRMTRGTDGRSFAEPLADVRSRVEFLEELGIRPSQLFLANCIIWVEGPSDIIYLRAAIAKVAPTLLPGRDFTFAMYGGASGAHLSFDTDDDDDQRRLVKLFKMSHHPVVVGDRDEANGETECAKMKKLRDLAEQAGVANRVKTTPGREIENAVKPDILKAALRTIRPGYVYDAKKKRVDIQYPPDFTLGSFDAFDSAASTGLNNDDWVKEKVKKHLSDRKVSLARAVVEAGIELTPEGTEFAKQLVALLRSPLQMNEGA